MEISKEGVEGYFLPCCTCPQYESVKNQLLAGDELPILKATFSRLSRTSIDSEPAADHDEGTT